MPDKSTIRKARADARAGKSASTQAGEFVKAEIDKIRSGVHGARSAKQAIAIGLSEARRSGVKVKSGRNASSSSCAGKTRRKPCSASAGDQQETLTRLAQRAPQRTPEHGVEILVVETGSFGGRSTQFEQSLCHRKKSGRDPETHQAP